MASTLAPMLESLIHTHVPSARTDILLKNELVAHCQDILTSHIGHKKDIDASQLIESVKRRLIQLEPNGTRASRFANLASRLREQTILSRRDDAILFLFSLSTLAGRDVPSMTLPILNIPTTSSRSNVKPPRTPTQSMPSGKGVSNAARLKSYRLAQGKSPMDETLLVRDTLYLMQGISGKYIRFAASNADDKKLLFANDCDTAISPSTQALIHRLAELGYLYSRVDSFVRERECASGVGMIEQSLCYYLQTQLTEYYRLIAVLEAQLSSSNEDSEGADSQQTRLSLRRLDVWVNDWRLRMRMMSVCVEGARDSHGGALVNLIHSYTDNGDPFVRKFTDELLEEVSRPFFVTLHKWLFSGELYDPFGEFFVTTDSTLGHVDYGHPSSIPGGISHPANDGAFGGYMEEPTENVENSQKLWETKYKFRKEMLPMFVGEQFGKKIYSTGKSLNFIRYSCLDSDWVKTREKMSNSGGTLQYGDISGLERSIDIAYQLASQRLFEVFIDKFKLLEHLSSLKQFLLLGHGVFADQLMETLGPSLSRPANTLYRHNLTANLETAVRSSNTGNDPGDVLRHLDARMLEYSHGEIGWDVFTLEYKISAPVDAVIDQEAMEMYLKLFRHLWQMKRIEKALDKGWMRVTGGAQTFIRLPDVERLELQHEWHKIRLTVSEMIHFIRQLEAYCRLEVIECCWKSLTDFLSKKEGDLDALIDTHKNYLNQITKKILLWLSKPGKEDYLLKQLVEIFVFILQFREAMDNFYNYCLTESSRRDSELDTQRGVFTGDVRYNDPETSRQELSAILGRLQEYSSSFSDRVQTLVAHLQSHPDLDCRFLAIRLSFSDYYKSVSASRKESTSQSSKQ